MDESPQQYQYYLFLLFLIVLKLSLIYTEFIKPGVSMESRRSKTGQKNILLSCPKTPRLHARPRLYEFGVLSLFLLFLFVTIISQTFLRSLLSILFTTINMMQYSRKINQTTTRTTTLPVSSILLNSITAFLKSIVFGSTKKSASNEDRWWHRQWMKLGFSSLHVMYIRQVIKTQIKPILFYFKHLRCFELMKVQKSFTMLTPRASKKK